MMRLSFINLAIAVMLAVSTCGAEKAKKAPARDCLVFRNGDLLYGSLDSIAPEAGVQWSRSDAPQPLVFTPESLTEIQLTPHPGSLTNAPNNCIVRLVNEDQLQGALVSYDGEKVVLDTWYAGQISIPNKWIAMLVPLGAPKPVLFAGPTGLEGWTMGKVNNAAIMDSGEWIYHNGALYAAKSASIARDVKLPETASLSFDIEWRGYFHIAIALYTEYLQPINLANKETEPKFGGFYSLQLNPFSANLLPVKQQEPLRYLGQAAVQSLAQKSSAHIDLRMSKSKRLIALLIDGVLVKQWNDADEFAGTGSAIRFVHQGQGAVKLSNLKVSEWDGTFEETPTLTAGKTQDITKLRNGDRVVGGVKSIQDGKMNVTGAGTDLQIPLTRVKQIELAGEKSKLAVPNKSIRAYFARGGSVTFLLEKMDHDTIVATSPAFGSVKIKTGAFERLLFDLTAAETL
jgi:hypothetical protein